MFDIPDYYLPAITRIHARSTPDKIALICEDGSLSWGDFEVRMCAFARFLNEHGIGRGDCVAVLAEPTIDAIVAQFGAIKSGAHVASLSGMVSGESLTSMIADSNAAVLIVDNHFLPRIEALLDALPIDMLRFRVFLGNAKDGWSSFREIIAADTGGTFSVPIERDQPYVLIYSSGTTSTPKGIVLSHGSRLANASVLAIEKRYDSRAIVFCATALYSHTTWTLLNLAFLVGGTAVVMRKFDAREALRLIDRYRVSHTVLVPAQVRMLLDAAEEEAADLGSIRTICTTGSAMTASLKQRTIERFPEAYFEIYGLTEGLVLILKPEDTKEHADSVGKPLLGNDIRIIDDAGAEVEPGERGEIVGYGPQLMLGYHKRAEATEAAIWREPDTGRTFLRSGDIGYFDADGFLHLSGRKKDMLVSGGYNIYPQDIEEVVVRHPAVVECSVIGVPHEKWGETPYAYVVARNGHQEPGDLLQWINEKVGKHERLNGMEWIDTLPRNAAGKVLKRELLELFTRSRNAEDRS